MDILVAEEYPINQLFGLKIIIFMANMAILKGKIQTSIFPRMEICQYMSVSHLNE